MLTYLKVGLAASLPWTGVWTIGPVLHFTPSLFLLRRRSRNFFQGEHIASAEHDNNGSGAITPTGFKDKV